MADSEGVISGAAVRVYNAERRWFGVRMSTRMEDSGRCSDMMICISEGSPKKVMGFLGVVCGGGLCTSVTTAAAAVGCMHRRDSKAFFGGPIATLCMTPESDVENLVFNCMLEASAAPGCG
jgi:hypothetical protein